MMHASSFPAPDPSTLEEIQPVLPLPICRSCHGPADHVFRYLAVLQECQQRKLRAQLEALQ